MTRQELFYRICPDGNMSGKRATQSYLERHGYWNDVLRMTSEYDADIKTRLAILKHGDIGRCETCGEPTKYIDGKFKRYCSLHSKKGNTKPHNKKIADEKRIIECYNSGMSAMMISKQEWCNVSHVTVQNILKRNGIETRTVSDAIKMSYSIKPWTVSQPSKIEWDKEYKVTTEPERIIQGILDRHSIDYIAHDRNQTKPKELDIFIPSHNLAIEINGLYWHSTSRPVMDRRHIDKFTECRQKGIRLMQFTDAMVYAKLNLVESMLLSKLGMLPNRIMARKCAIVDVSTSQANKLFSQWHYQGETNRSVKCIGLQHNNQIVALIAYRMNGNECRIERYACKLYTHITGGYSRLETELNRRYNIAQFTTYSLGLISDGKLYSDNGYTSIAYATRPEYYVTDGGLLYNRQKFMKHKLGKLFGCGYDETQTEWQNICANGLMLYFGAGITKWTKHNT